MCWASKCCFFLKLNVGCVLIAMASFMFSVTITAASAVLLLEYGQDKHFNHGPAHLPPTTKFLTFTLNPPKLHILLCSAFGMGFLLMLASVFLLIGIAKRKPGYVLFYFGFGIFFAIFTHLGGLLLLLDQHWNTSLGVFLAGSLYIHFLVVVHTYYDGLVQEKSDSSFDRLTENDFLTMGSEDENAQMQNRSILQE